VNRGRFWRRLDRLTAGVALAGVAATAVVGLVTARSQAAVDAARQAAAPAATEAPEVDGTAPERQGSGPTSPFGTTVTPRSGGSGRAHASSGGSGG
jgi:hypothetical protein